MLDLLRMQTRQKMEQVEAYTTGKSPQPTPWSRDRHKRTQTGTGKVSEGSSRRINTASMAAGRIQAKQRAGKECKPFPALLWNSPASKLWANGQHTRISPRQSQFWIFSKRKLIVSELQLLVFSARAVRYRQQRQLLVHRIVSYLFLCKNSYVSSVINQL